MVIEYQHETIFFGRADQFLEEVGLDRYSRVIVLCDEHTKRLCLPLVKAVPGIREDGVFVMKAGESNKNLKTCQGLWGFLQAHKADRHSVLINLGGGVVGDLGAFCAATYMRGMDFIQIPTSVLAQVDASVGGKTGINFDHYKNLLGTFSRAAATCIDDRFLKTLPQREVENGFVEILKYALIADKELWKKLHGGQSPDLNEIPNVIKRSIEIKQNIVAKDPFEKGHRKVLNFGHTVGHALERLALSQNQDIRHGEAVAFGILAAVHLSVELMGLPKLQAREIEQVIRPHCNMIPGRNECDTLIDIMRSDKKNVKQEFRFTLLSTVGIAVPDVQVEAASIKNSILQSINSLEEMRSQFG